MTAPKFDNVLVRPSVRMFINNRMIGPNDAVKTFHFTGDVLPKNTELAEAPVEPVKKAPLNGDTKPADAKAAVKAKAAGITGAEPA